VDWIESDKKSKAQTGRKMDALLLVVAKAIATVHISI
jgi:hypothetical protein